MIVELQALFVFQGVIWIVILLKSWIDLFRVFFKLSKYIRCNNIAFGKSINVFDVIFYKENEEILNYYKSDDNFKDNINAIRKIGIRFIIMLFYLFLILIIAFLIS